MTIADVAPERSSMAADDMLVRAAARIAERIGNDAWWNDERTRCNWMGRVDEDGSAQSAMNPCSAAFTAHLYSGAAGVALFLAELWRVRSDASLAHVVRSALAQAIENLRRPNDLPMSPLSFWVGDVGGAWVAARCAAIGVAPEGREEVRPLLDRAAAAFDEKHILDVVGGTAGAIPALLALARDPEWREVALALARRFGDELCDKARRGDQGAAVWDNEIASGFAQTSPPLTGFSHGASGIAFALLLLHGATGETRYLDVARGALVYEDAMFDETAGNWRDMRSYGQPGGFQTAWCHGAPGIGLTRLAAMRADTARADHYAAQVRVAAAATRAALATKLAEHRSDATLCHGIAGLADILLTFGRALGEPSDVELARAASLELVRRYDPLGDYPTAAPMGASNASFATGSAGIGHHFLRLVTDTPPVLALMPD